MTEEIGHSSETNNGEIPKNERRRRTDRYTMPTAVVDTSTIVSTQESGADSIPSMPEIPIGELPMGVAVDDNGEIARKQEERKEKVGQVIRIYDLLDQLNSIKKEKPRLSEVINEGEGKIIAIIDSKKKIIFEEGRAHLRIGNLINEYPDKLVLIAAALEKLLNETSKIPVTINSDESADSHDEDPNKVIEELKKDNDKDDKDDGDNNDEVGFTEQQEQMTLEEQLKRKVNEAVAIGQSFIDQLTNLFDLNEITDGSVITVNQDGIKDSLEAFSVKMDHVELDNEINKTLEAIKQLKEYLKTNQNASIKFGLERFADNVRFFLFQLTVENQKMSYWKPEGNNSDKGWITTTETAGKIYDKLRDDARGIILNQENIDQFSNLFDLWSQLNKIMAELGQLDNQMGSKVRNRKINEIYKPLSN